MADRRRGGRPSNGSSSGKVNPVSVVTGLDNGHESEELSVWRKIISNLRQLDTVRGSATSNAASINAMKKGMGDDVSSSASKLIVLLKEGISSADKEQRYSKDAAEQIGILMALREATETDSKRNKKRRADDISAVSTPDSSTKKSKRDRDGPYPIGTEVAFKTPKTKDPDETWILARIVRFFPDKNRYEVQDAEEDAGQPAEKYMALAKALVPLAAAGATIPTKSHDRDRGSSSLSPPPSSHTQPEFPSGSVVLALYPGTTCFYKATVVLPPSKILSSREPVYKLRFEDDNNQERQIERRMVIPSP